VIKQWLKTKELELNNWRRNMSMKLL